MSDVPDDLKYTAQHEWIRVGEGSTVRIGITDYAQQALGDVVYVSLPAVGADVTKGAAIGEIESTKSVSDLYAPLTGTVSACNDSLDEEPATINSDPYGSGWIIEIDATQAGEVGDLLDAAEYGSLAD